MTLDKNYSQTILYVFIELVNVSAQIADAYYTKSLGVYTHRKFSL